MLRRRVMVDVSKIDTSLDVLGQKLAFPIMLAPASKNRVVPQGDKVAAIGAHGAKAVYGIVGNAHAFIDDLTKAGQAPLWMASTLGDTTQGGRAELGAAQRGRRRDLAERDRRPSVHAEPRRQHPQRVPGLRSGRAEARRRRASPGSISNGFAAARSCR